MEPCYSIQPGELGRRVSAGGLATSCSGTPFFSQSCSTGAFHDRFVVLVQQRMRVQATLLVSQGSREFAIMEIPQPTLVRQFAF